MDKVALHERFLSGYPTPPILLVFWYDTWGSHGWGKREDRLNPEKDAKPWLIKSVGYFVESTEDYIVLAESITNTDNLGCTTFIPRTAVVHEQQLVPPSDDYDWDGH